MVRDVRQAIGSHITFLPAPDFVQLIGRVPSANELELGRLLFNDTILSRNNDTSCATCHLSNHGFADGNSLSVGALGRGGADSTNVGRKFATGTLQLERGFGTDSLGFVNDQFMFRNTLSTINVAYRMNAAENSGLLHDGRFGDLFFQVLLPIHTPEELCGRNPIPDGVRTPNPFAPKSQLFVKPVKIYHAHSFDPVNGQDLGSFNAVESTVAGVPSRRPDGSMAIPTRNECLAIAVAKVRSVPAYRDLIKRVYGDDEVSDRHIGRAIATFIMTHVAIDTPFDRFIKGDDSALTSAQLRGLAAFHMPLGQSAPIDGVTVRGAGCSGCHAGPEFGGHGFASLGVRSDRRSTQSRPANIADTSSGFFSRRHIQRGLVPACHVKSVSVTDASGIPYAPDIGRANATYKDEDCFKFRIPPLRNVLETYPYFHHGTARGQGNSTVGLEALAYTSLKEVIRYHLRGPQDAETAARLNFTKPYFDDLYQFDPMIPFFRQTFRPERPLDNSVFPYTVTETAVEDLAQFIAYGLRDPAATSRGALGNDVSHPTRVLSGFHPAITRDDGTQLELPPNAEPLPMINDQLSATDPQSMR